MNTAFSRNKKGQSAMEYLMTYGWAILIVIIVAAVLFSLGLFNPGTYTTTTAVGFSGFNVPAGGFQLTSAGILTVQIVNGAGATIDIDSASATIGTDTVAMAAAINNVAPGQTATLTFDFTAVGPYNTGSAYTSNVQMGYTNDNTGLAFVSSGTLTGSVS